MEPTEARSWLLPVGLGVSVVVGFIVRRWWPLRRRKTRVERLRAQAERLAARIKAAGKRTQAVVA